MNHVLLLGRMARDPEGKYMTNGEMVVGFSVAVERSYKDASGKRPVDFIRCAAFRKTAELICQYFKKGDPIGIHGSLQVREYTDRDGNKRSAAEVNCDSVYFPPSKPNNAGNHAQSTTSSNPSQDAESESTINPEDDLPF